MAEESVFGLSWEDFVIEVPRTSGRPATPPPLQAAPAPVRPPQAAVVLGPPQAAAAQAPVLIRPPQAAVALAAPAPVRPPQAAVALRPPQAAAVLAAPVRPPQVEHAPAPARDEEEDRLERENADKDMGDMLMEMIDAALAADARASAAVAAAAPSPMHISAAEPPPPSIRDAPPAKKLREPPPPEVRMKPMQPMQEIEPAKITVDELSTRDFVNFRDVWEFMPKQGRTEYANKIREILELPPTTRQTLGETAPEYMKPGLGTMIDFVPSAAPKSKVQRLASRQAAYLGPAGIKGIVLPATNAIADLRKFFMDNKGYFGGIMYLLQRWMTIPGGKGRVDKSVDALLQDVKSFLSPVAEIPAPKLMEKTQAKAQQTALEIQQREDMKMQARIEELTRVRGDAQTQARARAEIDMLAAKMRENHDKAEALRAKEDELWVQRDVMVRTRDKLTDPAKVARIQDEINRLEAQMRSIAGRDVSLGFVQANRSARLAALNARSSKFERETDIHVTPMAKEFGKTCQEFFMRRVKEGRFPKPMDTALMDSLTRATDMINGDKTLNTLRRIMEELRDKEYLQADMRSFMNRALDALKDVKNPSAAMAIGERIALPKISMVTAPEKPDLSALDEIIDEALRGAAAADSDSDDEDMGPPPVIEGALKEMLTDTPEAEVAKGTEESLEDKNISESEIEEYVHAKEPFISDEDGCGMIIELSDANIRDAVARLRRKKYVWGTFSEDSVMRDIEAIKAEGNPPTPDNAARIINAVIVPLVENMKQHIYYRIRYGNPGEQVPIGLTQLSMVASGKLTEDTMPIVSMHIPRFLKRMKLELRAQYAMHRGPLDSRMTARLEPGRMQAPSECLDPCTTGTLQKSMLFYPRFTTGTANRMNNSPMVAKPYDDKPETMPLCTWSPSPYLMITRAEPPANIRDFVLPCIVTKTVGLRNYWKENLMSGRVFLTLEDKTSGCAYRLGRFVCQGSGKEDAYYAWMAEAGIFANSYFYPIQNVTIFFTHYRQAEYDQFSRKKFAVRGNLQFCGHIRVRCCVPGEGNEYENQVWLGSVMTHIDGSLRTFLDGPDIELLDGDQSWYETGAAGQVNKLLIYEYFTDPLYRDNRRFFSGFSTMEDLWSRAITMLHVFRGILNCNERMMIFGEQNGMTNQNICPEEFVYSTEGMSLSGGPMSLGIYGKTARTNFHRVDHRHVTWNRMLDRSSMYQFSSLGIGATCAPEVQDSSVCDYYSRCGGGDGKFTDYPNLHSSDPFVPLWALEGHEWLFTHSDPVHHVQIRRHIITEQLMLLLRYVAHKMKLGLRYGTRDINGLMAALQCGTAPATAGPLAQKLHKYCQDKWDMALYVAQRTGHGSRWAPCLDAIISVLSTALTFKSTSGAYTLLVFNSLQESITSMSPMIDFIKRRVPLGAEQMMQIKVFDKERREKLLDNLNTAIETVERHIRADIPNYLIDKTAMK